MKKEKEGLLLIRGGFAERTFAASNRRESEEKKYVWISAQNHKNLRKLEWEGGGGFSAKDLPMQEKKQTEKKIHESQQGGTDKSRKKKARLS